MPPWQEIATLLSDDDLLVTAGFETPIAVWSVATGSLVAQFPAEWDLGRLRLCGTADRPIVVTASWGRPGVCGYEALTGTRLWERRDLTRSSSIAPAVDGDRVAVCSEFRSMHVLDAEAGATLATVRGMRGFWQSRHGSIGIGSVFGQAVGIDTERWSIDWRAPVEGFALLAAAFAPDGLVVSDTVDSSEGNAASVYAFDLAGRARWRYLAPRDCNVPLLGWDEVTGVWIGIQHNVNRSDSDRLLRWDRDGGVTSDLRLGGSFGYDAFLPTGRCLVTAEGRVLDTGTLQEVARFPAESRH